MDPSYASADEDADAMARFMGFSAFGTQGPPKKRKFNAQTDAIVDGQELASLDKGGKRGQGSGGNDVPLGKARVFGQAEPSAKINSAEIELDVEEDEEERLGAAGQPNAASGNGEDEVGPAYIDTSQPPPEEEARAAQARIDTILAQSSDTTAQPSASAAAKKKSQTTLPGRGLAGFMSALQGPLPSSSSASLSQPPPPTPLPSHASLPHVPPPGVTLQQQERVRGERNPLWYVGYYDPSFNENPWAWEEKSLGLQPLGTWLERPVRGP